MTNKNLLLGNHKIPITLSPSFSLTKNELIGKYLLAESHPVFALSTEFPQTGLLDMGSNLEIPVQITAPVFNKSRGLSGTFSVMTENASPVVIGNLVQAAGLMASGEYKTLIIDGNKKKKKTIWNFNIRPEDIMAVGALFLMVASGLTALLTIIFMGQKTIEPEYGIKIVIACVGGGTISGIVGAIVKKKKK